MLLIIFRSVIIFFVLLILLRLMGKRQIGEMQPFELVITLIVADLACFPMTETSIPLLYGVISLFGIFILHQLLIFLSNKSRTMEKIICGNPAMLIEQSKICIKNLEKMNLTANDLLETIRVKGICGFSAVSFAMIETSGQISFIEKENSVEKSFAQIIVEKGKIDKDQLKKISYSEEKLQDFLREKNIKTEDIYVMTVDYEEHIFCQLYEEN